MLCNSYQLYFTHSEVYPSHGCTVKIFKPISVTMNSVSPGTFSSLARPIINSERSACIMFTSQVYALPAILLASPGQLRLPPLAHAKSTVRRTNARCTMMTSQNIRKGARSGRNVGPEPQSLTLVNEYLEVRASFEQVGCMTFCRKIQGFNMKLAEQFTLRFDGSRAVIAGVVFQVTEETLSVTTKIPSCGERWFKGMHLDAWCYEDFIKRDCLGGKVETSIPSRYLQGPFQKLMEVIRKYFTCEGRFDIIHSHHIRLLMHFTGRRLLNIPFFLHQSLREMADNARAEVDQSKRKISHVSLIKLLMVEELR
jgi:hypothetical protein